MRAIAHGWTPSRMKSPPSRAVAQEFVEADRKYSGGFAENRYWTGGLAAMDEVTAGGKRGSLDLFKWQRGGRAGRRRNGGGGAGVLPTVAPPPAPPPAPSPWGTEAGTTQQMLDRMGYSGPMGYIGVVSGLRQAGWTAAPGGNDGDLRNTMWYPPEGTLTGGGGPGGPSEPPPRIIPTDPASYIGVSAEEKAALKESPYRDQLREHKAKIAATLGSARGGHVNYYEEGGAARPGHAEGPNPYEGDPLLRKSYARWEKKHHIDPPPPPEVVEAAPEEEDGGIGDWLRGIFTPDPETAIGSGESRGTVEEQMEEMEQAYGGRVGYQGGGLAIAAPAGGVPPWIEPTGVVEPVQEFQFGGGARGRRPYRGVPPQRRGIQRGAPPPQPGGGRGFLNRFRQQAQAQRGAPQGGRGFLSRFGGGQPQGGLAAMMRQAQQQQAGGRGLPPGIDPRAVAADPQGWAQQQMEQQRQQLDMQLPPFNRTPSGEIDLGGGRTPEWGPGGPGRGGGYGRTPFVPPGKRLPGNRIAPPPGKFPGGGGRMGTLGGPGYGPDPLGSAGPGGSLRGGPPTETTMPVGGPRVPPNMRGYLQKMRMQNRPPSGPVGGGGNRVGMADQQGALARAMQKGTGRAPTSRRFGRGRAGAGRGFQR